MEDSDLPDMAAMAQQLVRHNAGRFADEILASPAGAFLYLSHVDPLVRFCAMECYHRFWSRGSDPQFLKVCEALIEADPDERVQRSAVQIAKELLRGTCSCEMEGILAAAALDEQRSPMLRAIAFAALWEIEHGSSAGIRDHTNELTTAVVEDSAPSLAYVDWEFVRKFAGCG